MSDRHNFDPTVFFETHDLQLAITVIAGMASHSHEAHTGVLMPVSESAWALGFDQSRPVYFTADAVRQISVPPSAENPWDELNAYQERSTALLRAVRLAALRDPSASDYRVEVLLPGDAQLTTFTAEAQAFFSRRGSIVIGWGGTDLDAPMEAV